MPFLMHLRGLALVTFLALLATAYARADPAPLAAWTAYLGWSFQSTTGSAAALPTMRMQGTQGPLKFTLLRRGGDYAYSLLDLSGNRLLRIVRNAGRLTVYDHAGNVNPAADPFARDMNAIVEVLTNDIATHPAHSAADPHVVLVDLGMQRIATVELDEGGLCSRVVIEGGKTRTMRPERVSNLPHDWKFYTAWRINGERWTIDDVLPNNPIADDELTAH